MSIRDLRRNLRRLTPQRAGTVGLVRWLPWADLATPWSRVDQITLWEQAWITKWLRQHPPTGHVVELGALAGASTVAIGRGVRGRDVPVVVYDAFDRRYLEPENPLLADVRPLRAIYDQRTRRHAPRSLVVNQGDVRDMGWNGQPISFLFVDLAKTPGIWEHVASTWVASVEPGGVMVQQDWSHAVAPWLHAWHTGHPEWVPVADVPYSGSRVFRRS